MSVFGNNYYRNGKIDNMNIEKMKILLVEDEALIAINTASKIEELGYDVSYAISGSKAMIHCNNNDVDLILMDIDLGNSSDGVTIAQNILKLYDIPIVFMSSHTETKIIARTEEVTSYGYIVKGSNINVVGVAIKMALKLFNAHTKLNASEHRYYTMFNNITNIGFALHEMIYDGYGVAIDYRFLKINKMFEALTSLKEENVIGKTVKQLMPNIEQYWIDTYANVVAGQKSISYENYSKSLEKEFNVDAFHIEGNLFATVFTEKKDEIILKEVHHRIKNNMTMIMSLLSWQSSNHKDNIEAVQILQEAEDRIRGMMLLYDKLYTSNYTTKVSSKDYFESLINEIIINYSNKYKINTNITIDEFMIGSKMIFNLGLIVNELIVNCMKYAFNSDGGNITVNMSKDNNTITLIIEDDGVGLPDDFKIETISSFGLTLVKVLVEQFFGTINIDVKKGTKFSMKFDTKA